MITDTLVCMTPRVLAAGIAGDRFRLTIALLPTTPAASPGSPTFPLEDWPRAVSSLGPISLHVSPVERDGARPAPRYASAAAVVTRLRHRLDTADADAAAALWKTVMTGHAEATGQRSEFLHLCRTLARSQTVPTASDQANPADCATKGTPTILPTGRADAALAYTMERAERILSTLRDGPHRPCRPGR